MTSTNEVCLDCFVIVWEVYLLMFGVRGCFEWIPLPLTSTMVGSLFCMGPLGHMLVLVLGIWMSIAWTHSHSFNWKGMSEYASIRRIAYLKPGMGFSEGNTFFNDDHGSWGMLKWVREGKIDVYCECVIEKRQ